MVVPTARSRSLLRLFGGAHRGPGEQTDVDALTGLPTRAAFVRRLERLLSQRQRTRGGPVCTLLLIDCDSFREVNRAVGHVGGDRVLSEVAERLRQALPAAHTVARVGGDEFAVLLDEVPDAAALMEQGEQLVNHLHAPLRVHGSDIHIEASIGVALCGRDEAADGGEVLLHNADIALQMAKQRGKGRFGLFEASLRVALDHPVRFHASLDTALARRQFLLRYQPIVALPSRRIVGFEALLRWHHPDGRTLEPAEFLSELESTGLIESVGRWVLGEACARAAELRNETGADLFVMVNVSGRQLRDPAFIANVNDALWGAHLGAESLVLELTESTTIAEDENACRPLEELRALGVRVAIDDVGTGYSSMSHLQRFPVDALKVDPSFVRQLVDGPQQPTAADDLFRLGGSLGLTTVAEGVETEEQHLAVTRLGCPMAQGYFYAPPLTGAELSLALLHQTGQLVPPGD